jgi:hypothetical protein
MNCAKRKSYAFELKTPNSTIFLLSNHDLALLPTCIHPHQHALYKQAMFSFFEFCMIFFSRLGGAYVLILLHFPFKPYMYLPRTPMVDLKSSAMIEQFFSYLAAVITGDRVSNLDLCVALMAFSRVPLSATKVLGLFGLIQRTVRHLHM